MDGWMDVSSVVSTSDNAIEYSFSQSQRSMGMGMGIGSRPTEGGDDVAGCDAVVQSQRKVRSGCDPFSRYPDTVPTSPHPHIPLSQYLYSTLLCIDVRAVWFRQAESVPVQVLYWTGLYWTVLEEMCVRERF